MAESSLLRRRGLKALQGHWQTALLITFGAGIFDTALRVFQIRVNLPSMAGSDLLSILGAFQRQDNSFLWIYYILFFLGFVFTSALGIGLNNYFLCLHRGQATGFFLLFSRMRIFGKCLGQALLIALLILLWSLILIPGAYLIALARVTSMVVVTVLVILLIIPSIVAGFRYAMAPYLLADNPDIGVISSIRNSREIMKGNKGRLFWLDISFVGWFLLSVLIAGVLAVISPVLGTVAGLFTSLALQVYVNSATAAFYLDLTSHTPQPEEEMQ